VLGDRAEPGIRPGRCGKRKDHRLVVLVEAVLGDVQNDVLLLGCGLNRLGFCGYEGVYWSKERQASFAEAAGRRNLPLEVYNMEKPGGRLGRRPGLAAWLKSLGKPAGVMACNDECARRVVDACREAGIRVPEDIAVLGVDNDQFVCDLSFPPISSIDRNCDKAGFEAASLLDRMMRRRKQIAKAVVVEPTGVVKRRSTDILAIEDQDVARAVRFIEDNASGGITAGDVARAAPISRRGCPLFSSCISTYNTA
jgi:LacI family transcriptional regulator